MKTEYTATEIEERIVQSIHDLDGEQLAELYSMLFPGTAEYDVVSENIIVEEDE